MFTEECRSRKYKPCLHTMRFSTFGQFGQSVFYTMASWRGISGNTLCANKGKFCNYFAESLRSLFDVSSLSLSRSLPFPEGSKAAKQYSTTSSIKAKVHDSYFFMRLDFYARDQGDVFDSGCNCMKVIYFLLLQFHF